MAFAVRIFAIAVALAFAGCGDDEATTAAAASSGGPDAGPTGCAAGEADDNGTCRPAGVPASACAAGFTPEADGCAPVLPPMPCGPGELAVPGETQCHPVAPCAPGTWGDIPVDGKTQFVAAAYAGGSSDGTKTKPWTRLQDAVDAAAPGAIVAIAAGTYEAVQIAGSSVRLWGVCPEDVSIEAVSTDLGAIFVQDGADGTEIRDLAISGGAVGLVVSGSKDVHADRIWIHATHSRGVDEEDSLGPTSLSVSRSLVEAAHELGLFAAGAELVVDASVVRGTVPGTVDDLGGGVQASDATDTHRRAALHVSGSLFDGNTMFGVFVVGSDATIEATVVRGTLPRKSDLGFGRGITMETNTDSGERAIVTVRSSVLAKNLEAAIFVQDSGATIEATTVADTGARASDQETGRGVDVEDGPGGGRSTVKLESSLIRASHEAGVVVLGSDATILATIVRQTLPRATDQRAGRGINVQHDSATGQRGQATIRSSVIDDNSDTGLLVLDADATIERTLVRGTHAQPDGTYGDGIGVFAQGGSAEVSITSSRVVESARAGVGNFGSTLSLGGSLIECNTIALDGEDGIVPYTFNDLGGNACGCPGSGACKVLSSSLSPPEPLP